MKSSMVSLLSFLLLMLVFIGPSAAVVPTANFIGTPTTGSAPLEVTFTDQSTGNPTGWAWFFGDETYNVPWTQMTASAGWGPRYGHTSVVMPDGSIILMGGREYPDTRMNDVWRSTDNGATWKLMTANGEWEPRAGHSSVVMSDGSIILMGGVRIGGRMNDVWRSTDYGATWKLMTANAEWTGREFFTSVVMPDGSIVLMGGYNGRYLNDVWRSTDNGASWTQMTANAEWTKRQIHTSVVMPDGAILLGGSGGLGDFKNDVWRSTDNGATWTLVTASAEWEARYHHTSVVMPDGSIVLMGGSIISALKNDVWRSTDNGATWAQITANAGWSARYSHTSVVMPDGSIILMGGGTDIAANSGYKNDVWRYQPVGSSEKNPSHTYTIPGIYTVALQVSNSEGYDNTLKTGYIIVTATNQPPVASAGPDQTVIVNEPVKFDGSISSDSDGTIVTYAWNFGDTKTGSGVTTSHTYTTAGTYTVTLTVTDNGGLTGSDTAVITVKPSVETVQDLITNVDGLGLPKGIEQGLLAKLDTAEKKIAQEQYTPARNTLNAFINQVNAQRGKALTDTRADELIAIAQRIINTIPGK